MDPESRDRLTAVGKDLAIIDQQCQLQDLVR